MKRAVFLDRDGTLNHDAGYTHRIEDLHIIEGVIPGLRIMESLGFELIVVTNQSGIGRGYYSEEDMQGFNSALIAHVAASGICIRRVYYAPFFADSAAPQYRLGAHMRKPAPGMILQAAEDYQLDLNQSYVVGDSLLDIRAGKAAGCTTILIANDSSNVVRQSRSAADHIVKDMVSAAHVIRVEESRSNG